ncbi:MAG: hypothetical protein ACLQLG_00200 [Thermoguttaceae bacterium]
MNSTPFLPHPEDWPPGRNNSPDEPQPIGKILAELLARYQERFPGVRIALVETSDVAICLDN